MNDQRMSLAALTEFLEERLKSTLPGSAAHATMFPLLAGNVRPKYDVAGAVRQGSVLILLYEEEGEVYFPLIKRPSYPGVHGGQISLPGGKAEPGETPVGTALREAEEEIGADGRRARAIGQLTSFTVVVSNIFITPVVGIFSGKPDFKPDPREVERILICSVDKLLRQEEILKKEIVSGGSLPLVAPHFEVDQEIVWGATAMVLNEFRLVLRGG